jgi:hypothetical protein
MSDGLGALMMHCPASGRAVNSGIFVHSEDVPGLARLRLRVRCPHCGAPHELSVSDTFIDTRGVLPRARPQLTLIARDVA